MTIVIDTFQTLAFLRVTHFFVYREKIPGQHLEQRTHNKSQKKTVHLMQIKLHWGGGREEVALAPPVAKKDVTKLCDEVQWRRENALLHQIPPHIFLGYWHVPPQLSVLWRPPKLYLAHFQNTRPPNTKSHWGIWGRGQRHPLPGSLPIPCFSCFLLLSAPDQKVQGARYSEVNWPIGSDGGASNLYLNY